MKRTVWLLMMLGLLLALLYYYLHNIQNSLCHLYYLVLLL